MTTYNTPHIYRRHPWEWLPSKLSLLPNLSTSSTDKIDNQYFKSTNSTQLPLHPSDIPFQESLNHSSASRSFGSRFTATISPHDYLSFITDNHQTWLTQPPSPRPTTQQHTPQNFTTPEADFVLFPTPSTRPARRQTELAQVTSRTALNHSLGQTSPGQQYQDNLQHRRESTHQQPTSVSPYQNLRVRSIIQGTGPIASSTTSPRFSPTGQHQQQNFYASSAPSSTTALQQSPSTRPPVPLFPRNSTGHLSQQIKSPKMAYSHSFDGTYSCTSFRDVLYQLTCIDVEMNNPFDMDHSSRDFASVDDFSLFDSQSPTTNFNAINAGSAQVSANPQTVSPQDIFSDSMSAPPSGAYTNLSTPATYPYDSPFAQMITSTETSPIFQDDDIDVSRGTEKWHSLFPENDENDDIFRQTLGPAARSAPQLFENSVAPPMSRNKSSPGQSSSRGSNHGRHSSVSGVNPRKRNNPLPPITIEDPTDPVAVKRARNTQAARKSRMKKTEKFEEAYDQIESLTLQVSQSNVERDQSRAEVVRLTAENNRLKANLRNGGQVYEGI